MRVASIILVGPLLCLAVALGADDPKPDQAESRAVPSAAPVPSVRKSALAPAAEFDPALEAEALGFVREHHPELAAVLEVLRPMNPAEYRKAVVELSQVARTLAELKGRNHRRHDLALEGWKAKSRVELLAAQLAGSPGEELRSQLRSAIEAKVEVEIARQRFELQQAEAAAKKAREMLDRLEKNRDSVVENRFRALQPKKLTRAKKPTSPSKIPAPASPDKPANPPASKNPNGEDRR